MMSKCAGCLRSKTVHPNKFPHDYPKDMMMCCACTWSYYHHLGIPQPNGIDFSRISSIYRQKSFLEDWWGYCGDNIEKVMRIL